LSTNSLTKRSSIANEPEVKPLMHEKRDCKIIDRHNLGIASLKEQKKSMQQESEEDLKVCYKFQYMKHILMDIPALIL
jgi:hypothetical protein